MSIVTEQLERVLEALRLSIATSGQAIGSVTFSVETAKTIEEELTRLADLAIEQHEDLEDMRAYVAQAEYEIEQYVMPEEERKHHLEELMSAPIRMVFTREQAAKLLFGEYADYVLFPGLVDQNAP